MDFAARAIETLARLSYTFRPNYDDFFAMLMSPILAILPGFFASLAALMLELFWQRSQEAEFRADYAAAQVGGSEAARSLLRKTDLHIYLRPVLDPISFSLDWRGQSFVPAFKAFLAALPPLERERLRRAEGSTKFETHTSHPPHWARLPSSLSITPPRPCSSPMRTETARIDRELKRLEPVVTSKLLALHSPNH